MDGSFLCYRMQRSFINEILKISKNNIVMITNMKIIIIFAIEKRKQKHLTQ